MADDPAADGEGRRLRAEFLQEMREIEARRAADAERAVPLVELCRPIVDAAYTAFLRNPERWADGIIVNIDRRLKNDVSFHASESKEAIWNLAHLMAYFRPDNNPYIEALRHVGGTRPDRDKSDGVKRDPTGAYVQNLARYSRNGLRPAWVCEPFPEGTTQEQALVMLRRWYKLATGREFGETIETPAGAGEGNVDGVASDDTGDARNEYQHEGQWLTAKFIKERFNISGHTLSRDNEAVKNRMTNPAGRGYVYRHRDVLCIAERRPDPD